MKIVVIGGTGLIGSKVVQLLQRDGHEVLAASPKTGVDTLTGAGLATALAGAKIVVDVANSPSFEDKAVLDFFETAGRNIAAAEKAAGVQHHVALSVVGTDRNPESGYLRAKLAQETLIRNSGIPFTIVRATQFFEFVGAIVQAATDGDHATLPTAFMQPMAADDVAAAVAQAALGAPHDGVVDIAGPEKIRIYELGARYLQATHDQRSVVADPTARYFGAVVDDGSLVPAGAAQLSATRFDDWIARTAQAAL